MGRGDGDQPHERAAEEAPVGYDIARDRSGRVGDPADTLRDGSGDFVDANALLAELVGCEEGAKIASGCEPDPVLRR